MSFNLRFVFRFMVQFMKALNRMQKDHVAGQQGEGGGDHFVFIQIYYSLIAIQPEVIQ